MIKTRRIICFMLVLTIVVSCKNKNDVETIDTNVAASFVGEYDLYTTFTTYSTKSTNVVEGSGSTDMSIYEEGGKYLVQTENFGFPRTATAIRKTPMGLEPIDTTKKTLEVLLYNGIVLCLNSGRFHKSKPIPVKSTQNQKLRFNDSDAFETAIVRQTLSGLQIYANADCYFEYGPLENHDTHLTWTVVLRLSNYQEKETGGEEIKRIVYTNTAYRK